MSQIIKVEVSQIVEKVDTALVRSIDLKRSGLLKQMDCQLVQKQADSDVANLLLVKCNAGIKAIDSLRLDMTKPLREETKRINVEFDTILAPMKQTKMELSHRLMSWRSEEDRKHAEELAKAQAEEERRQKISDSKGGTGEHIKPVEKPVDQLSMRDTTKFRVEHRVAVVDITKIPMKYFDNEEIINAVRKQLQRELGTLKERKGRFFSPEDFKVPGAAVETKKIPIY